MGQPGSAGGRLPHSPDRRGEHPRTHLAKFRGVHYWTGEQTLNWYLKARENVG